MALPELIAALRARAAEQRAQELARADAEAEKIRSESRAALARRKTEQVEHAIRGAEETARKTLSETRANATASVLVAHDRLLERVRSAVEARARESLADPVWVASLAEWLGGALDRLPPGDVLVRVPPELAEVLAGAVAGRQGVRMEPAADVGTGFVASSSASGVEIECTLESELRHRWPRIAVSVLAEVAK